MVNKLFESYSSKAIDNKEKHELSLSDSPKINGLQSNLKSGVQNTPAPLREPQS